MSFQIELNQIVRDAVAAVEMAELRQECAELMKPSGNALWSESDWHALRCTAEDPLGLSVDVIPGARCAVRRLRRVAR